MIAVTHLAVARSQNTGSGISGAYTKEEAVITTAFSFVWGISGERRMVWGEVSHERKLEKFCKAACDSGRDGISVLALASPDGIG